jgi:hypothetical protein
MTDKQELIAIARQCIAMGKRERPELIWLKKIYEDFREKNGGISRAEADRILYREMYGQDPKSDSSILKIRYWRTGHHMPANRSQCLDFGRALGMDEKEERYLLQYYFDRSDRLFEDEPLCDADYDKRKNCMEQMVGEYLMNVHPRQRMHLKITKSAMKNSVRHLYFTDALKYIDAVKIPGDESRSKTGHFTSINYDSELSRNMKLLGEVPRKTIIRHILVLGIPYLNRRIIDERLEILGFAPLNEEHTLPGGEHLDWLIIKLFEIYERECRGKTPEECISWFQAACRTLDGYFARKEADHLRFMYFKALNA